MFCIEIAGLLIGIHHRFAFLPAQCGAYLTCQPPRFTVCASDEALFREAAADRRYPPLSPPNRFAPERPWGYYESLCVCRAICRRLPFYDAFLIHAAALEVDGAAYLFAAPSGTGKTTHARLWQQQLGPKAHFINGDKPVLRVLDGTFFACGTPWNGKEGLGANLVCPVGGICFLERGTENRIRRLAPAELLSPGAGHRAEKGAERQPVYAVCRQPGPGSAGPKRRVRGLPPPLEMRRRLPRRRPGRQRAGPAGLRPPDVRLLEGRV